MSWRCPICRTLNRPGPAGVEYVECGHCSRSRPDVHRRPEPAATAAPSSPPAPPDPAPRSGGRPAASAAPSRPSGAGAPRPSALLRAVAPQLEAHGRAWCEAASDEQLEELAARLAAWEPSTLRRLHSLVSKALAGSWARSGAQEA